MSTGTPVLRAVVFSALLASLAGCAAPGVVVHGTLRPPETKARQARSATARSPWTDAVLFVDGADSLRLAPAHHTAPLALAYDSRGLEPRIMVISRYDSLVFRNDDQRWHRPFSVSPGASFDAGSIKPGASRAVRLPRDGIVRVFCRLHSEPSVLVYVAPTRDWIRPDSTGAFTLPRLPAGSYEIKAWHPRFGERHWRVQVAPEGTALELEF